MTMLANLRVVLLAERRDLDHLSSRKDKRGHILHHLNRLIALDEVERVKLADDVVIYKIPGHNIVLPEPRPTPLTKLEEDIIRAIRDGGSVRRRDLHHLSNQGTPRRQCSQILYNLRRLKDRGVIEDDGVRDGELFYKIRNEQAPPSPQPVRYKATAREEAWLIRQVLGYMAEARRPVRPMEIHGFLTKYGDVPKKTCHVFQHLVKIGSATRHGYGRSCKYTFNFGHQSLRRVAKRSGGKRP